MSYVVSEAIVGKEMNSEEWDAVKADILEVLKKHSIPVFIPEGEELLTISESHESQIIEFQSSGAKYSMEGKRSRAKLVIKLIDKRYGTDY